MKYIFILISLLTFSLKGLGQYKYENFNRGIPSNWSTISPSKLSLGVDHYKDGGQSLKWKAVNGAVITIKDLNLPKNELENLTSTSEIFIYSLHPSQDTLVFQFFDRQGQLQREGKWLLNYTGWREYRRNFITDYSISHKLEGFELDQCRIVYKAAKGSKENVIYFDAVKFIGDKQIRQQATPQTIIDRPLFNVVGLAGGDPLGSWLNQPTLGITKVSEAMLKDIEHIRMYYKRKLAVVKPEELKEALAYVKYAQISRNADQSIKGRGLLAISNPDTLVKVSSYCGVMASAILLNHQVELKESLINFTEYLIDQGVAEGGSNVLPTNTYGPTRKFPLGFLDALSVYPPPLKAKVIAMLKWSHEYNKIYADQFVPGLNTDYMHLKSAVLFELALADPSTDRVASDLSYLSRFLARNAVIGEGGLDGIKADGLGFHHSSHHVSYLFAYESWIERAFSLKGTTFKISEQAYKDMCFAIKTLLLETSQGEILANTLAGRNPFPAKVPVSAASVVKLIAIGDDRGVDTSPLKSLYNYIYQVNKYQVKVADLDGFYQFNYGQLGVLRKNNWVAYLRGFTDKMFGSEIYEFDNRYGRYQSYGSLEILYNGSLQKTGYIANGKGWDWNVVPGTTTVHLPWKQLNPFLKTASEFQQRSFSGALSLGSNGIFAIDFVEDAGNRYHPSELGFRKSVFAFGDLMVCLGSDINIKDTTNQVATNLFQNITTINLPALDVQGKKISATNYQQNINLQQQSFWMINGFNTGYYLPRGNQTINIYRGEQETPDQKSIDNTKNHKALVNKAWIVHGKSPKNEIYHFVVVPDATPEKMAQKISLIEEKKVYTVLKQTKDLHVLKYLPENLTAYVFFESIKDLNIGEVNGISGPALLAIKNLGDSLKLSIVDPDLHAVADKDSMWKSTEHKVTVLLNGNWRIIGRANSVTAQHDSKTTALTFSLINGLAKEIILKKDN